MVKDKKLKRKWNYYIVDGNYYEMVTSKDGESYLQFISKEEFNRHNEAVDYIIDEVVDKLEQNAMKLILKEAIMRLPIEEVERIKKEFEQEEIDDDEIDVRPHFCIDLKIGKTIVPIING